MKRTPLLTIWVLSFMVVALIANPDNCVFWIAVIVFSWASIYLEKHSERLENEDE